MSAPDSPTKPNSNTEWTFPLLTFFGAPTLGRPHLTEQTAQASLVALDMVEAWLTATRQMIDLWRIALREVQDGTLASYRQQVVSALAHDLLEDMEVPARAAAKRQPLPKTAVAKPATAQAA